MSCKTRFWLTRGEIASKSVSYVGGAALLASIILDKLDKENASNLLVRPAVYTLAAGGAVYCLMRAAQLALTFHDFSKFHDFGNVYDCSRNPVSVAVPDIGINFLVPNEKND